MKNFELGFTKHESGPKVIVPWQMTLPEFVDEYQKTMSAVAGKEKSGKLDPDTIPYEPVTEEEKEILSKDWKEFSRGRGFSEADIEEYEKWLILSGQKDNLPGNINDPWRRTLRHDWPKRLWTLHVGNAIERGERVPSKVRIGYEEVKKELKIQSDTQETTSVDTPIPSPSSSGTDADIF